MTSNGSGDGVGDIGTDTRSGGDGGAGLMVLNMDTQVWSVQVDNPELLGHQAQ